MIIVYWIAELEKFMQHFERHIAPRTRHPYNSAHFMVMTTNCRTKIYIKEIYCYWKVQPRPGFPGNVSLTHRPSPSFTTFTFRSAADWKEGVVESRNFAGGATLEYAAVRFSSLAPRARFYNGRISALSNFIALPLLLARYFAVMRVALPPV